MTSTNQSLIPWGKYLILTAESLLTFYLATFCLAMFYTHRGPYWIITGSFLAALYLFIVAVCIKRIIQNVPIAGLMLAIPIIPLFALFMVISLIPLMQLF